METQGAVWVGWFIMLQSITTTTGVAGKQKIESGKLLPLFLIFQYFVYRRCRGAYECGQNVSLIRFVIGGGGLSPVNLTTHA